MAEKIKYCDNCNFLSKCRVTSGVDNFSNYYCNHTALPTKRIIDVSHNESKQMDTPSFCPFNETKFVPTIIPMQTTHSKKCWSDMQPKIKFEDLKEGNVYHIPPYNGHKREDIIITNKTSYSASYRTLNTKSIYNYNTLYPNTIAMKIITEHKIQKIEANK